MMAHEKTGPGFDTKPNKAKPLDRRKLLASGSHFKRYILVGSFRLGAELLPYQTRALV